MKKIILLSSMLLWASAASCGYADLLDSLKNDIENIFLRYKQKTLIVCFRKVYDDGSHAKYGQLFVASHTKNNHRCEYLKVELLGREEVCQADTIIDQLKKKLIIDIKKSIIGGTPSVSVISEDYYDVIGGKVARK